MLSVRGMSVRYGAFAAISDVDLDIADGEVLALLGPSGSGKSTLLRAITGLEPAAVGSVRWNDVDLTRTPVHRRGFGLVFQDGQLFPHRSVAENLAFGLRMHRVPGDERNRRVAELLELVGLRGYGDRSVTELSGGEAQRVALARALAPQPRLLLLDEPLSSLDASLREQLAIDLARVLRDASITALLVTHDQEEAFTLADRLAILDQGRIRQIGEVTEVWRHPADDRVAAFLGVTTVLAATVCDGVARCSLGAVTVCAPDGQVRLGLRPSAVRVSETGTPGMVRSVVHRRDHVRLVVELPGDPSTVDAIAGTAAGLEPGDVVSLRLDPDGVAVVAPGGL